VLEAEDGVAALTLVEAYQGTLDLLVTALEMPGVDGEALAARLLILHPEARVLYLGSTEGASSREPVLPRDGLPGRLVEMVDALFEGATPA
jgi:CheY-like chemotaxis protein